MLTYQDNRLRHQPNSIISKDDGIYQLSALTAFRALLPRFWRWRDAPFVVNLTDLHQSNVFVDEDWNITRVIDLEFAPVRPLQMARVPSWLNSRSIDELTDTHLEEYQALYDEFVKVVEQEENHFGQQDHTLSRKFREDWGMFYRNTMFRHPKTSIDLTSRHGEIMVYPSTGQSEWISRRLRTASPTEIFPAGVSTGSGWCGVDAAVG